MPNVTWQEPQILLDLLAVNLFAELNGLTLPGARHIAVITPWFSNVELFLRPCPWHQQLTLGEVERNMAFRDALAEFSRRGWQADVAVLNYGRNPSGLEKPLESFRTERLFLQRLLDTTSVRVFLVPDLHAKGVVTPLGIITGSTNITHSGLYAQSQNANYFAHDSADYAGNRTQLLGRYDGLTPVERIP
jgi:hypothetical protein